MDFVSLDFLTIENDVMDILQRIASVHNYDFSLFRSIDSYLVKVHPYFLFDSLGSAILLDYKMYQSWVNGEHTLIDLKEKDPYYTNFGTCLDFKDYLDKIIFSPYFCIQEIIKQSVDNPDLYLTEHNRSIAFSFGIMCPVGDSNLEMIKYFDDKQHISSPTCKDTIAAEIKTLINSHNQHSAFSVKVYKVSTIEQICGTSFKAIFELGYIIKQCANCGKFFIPPNRSDTLYCTRISPQDCTKTCKEYGAQKAWQDRLKNDESAKLYRNIYMAKQMLAKRNPDIEEYKTSFEKFKRLSKQWKADVKAGAKTDAEFLEWLKAVKEKRLLLDGKHPETR